MSTEKPVIVMQPGPLHLFWTTGVFYVWLLKERFDFVLLVPPSYQSDVRFAKIEALQCIRHVEYMPPAVGLRWHRAYSRLCRTILRRYRPACLLLHNRCYIENQYLIHWSRKLCPSAVRYQYQNGRMALMWANDFALRRAIQIERFIARHPWLSGMPGLAGRLARMRHALAFALNFKVWPMLVAKASFSPPIDATTGRIDRRATIQSSNTRQDVLLAYLENEIRAYRAQGVANIVQVRHPASDCGGKVFRALYGAYAESKTILVLPSNGFAPAMIEAGWRPDELAAHISGKWTEAIQKLLEAFPGFSVSMKLHPASVEDPLWRDILAVILSEFPSLNIVDPMDSAEWHVVRSNVIVGDVTTVLWWAGLYGGKIVISLDIFGYPGGDELKEYPDIIQYRNKLDGLRDAAAAGSQKRGMDVLSVIAGEAA